jgi:glucose-6-phosphate isomerase
MKVLASKMKSAELDKYLSQITAQYEKPDLKVHFPTDVSSDEIESVQKESHKVAMV